MGALDGLRVLELAGVGPCPFAGMMLATHGAELLRVARLRAGVVSSHAVDGVGDLLDQGKRTIGVDLKHPDGVGLVLDLVAGADVLIEGFRPGVTERLGLGPDQCLARNPRLVYGRMTGWGQDGPLSSRAGHDVNYLAAAGALDHIGRAGQLPTPPLNLIADFGGGGMMLAFGVLAALQERERSGRGQVVDAAMVDGVSTLMTMFYGMDPLGPRGTNLLDSGAPYYDVYSTADGGTVAVGALEPQFFAELLDVLGIADEGWTQSQETWPDLRRRMAEVLLTRTRDEWVTLAGDRDACLSPVISMQEAPALPHNRARNAFTMTRDGMVRPSPAPRLSRTPGLTPTGAGDAGDADEWQRWGIEPTRVGALVAAGIVA